MFYIWNTYTKHNNMDRKVVLTPIKCKQETPRMRAKGKPCARTDFNEQKKRNEFILDGNEFWVWDDAASNQSRVGDIFVFWDYDGVGKGGPGNPWGGGQFIFHSIVGVKSPKHRLSSWTNNVGQGDRNVLELSPPLFTLTYAEMIQYGTTPNYRGTYYPTTGFSKDSSIMSRIEKYLSP